MRTKKLRVAAFALSLGLLVGDFGGISQIHAAEVSDPFLGNDYWMGNDPMFGENQINNPVDVPPVNDIIYTKEIIEGDSHQISLFNIPGVNIIWLSSNTDVAIVTMDGNVIGLSEGETIITAIYDGSEYRYLIKVRSSSKTDLSKWIEKKGRYYYHNPYGKKVTGKVTIGKKTFYFDKQGRQRVGWIKSSGKYYYYQIAKKNKGYMLTNKKVNGISLGKDGAAKVTKTNKKKLQLYVDACECVFEETNWNMTRKQALKKMFLKLAKDEIITYKTIGHFRNIKQWDVYYSNQYFSKGYGDCYTYASAMAYFALALGYEDIWVCSSGSHGWCRIDGLYYDPRYANWGTSDMMKAFAVPDELCGKGGRMNWKRYSYYRCKVD